MSIGEIRQILLRVRREIEQNTPLIAGVVAAHDKIGFFEAINEFGGAVVSDP